MDAQGGNRLLTAKIVGSYLRHNTVGANQVPELIAIVHRSLGELGQQPAAEELLTPAVSIRQSVRHDYVVCLDCGYRARMLRRHLNSRHGLSRAEYLKRWGLKPDHPLTAPAYSEHRSTLAKQLGLGRKPNAAAEASEASGDGMIDTNAKPKRVSRSGPKSDVPDAAGSEPTKTRRRRTRSRSDTPQPELAATPVAKA
jgi:predicted transcriptional regulator